MSIISEVYRVLTEAGEPLHYQEITRRMQANGWTSQGLTPWATVNAILAMDIKNRGPASRFVRSQPAVFTLNPNPVPELSRPRRQGTRMPSMPGVEIDEDGGTLSFSEAAERILRESGQPMHYETITELALDQGLIESHGLTPAATMYSVIYGIVRRREARGDPPRFVMQGKGFVGLGSLVSQGLAAQIEVHNRGVRDALLARVMETSPQAFEELVGELLVALGFEEVAVTRLSGDNGIDVRGTLVVGEVVRIRMAVQAKRWKANVQSPEVQRVRGSLGAHEQGLIITTSDFGSGARTEAARPDAAPVALMNGEQLAALLATHEIGVRSDRHVLYSLDEVTEPEA